MCENFVENTFIYIVRVIFLSEINLKQVTEKQRLKKRQKAIYISYLQKGIKNYPKIDAQNHILIYGYLNKIPGHYFPAKINNPIKRDFFHSEKNLAMKEE